MNTKEEQKQGLACIDVAFFFLVDPQDDSGDTISV
jgi:hypothetical protein